MEYVFDESKIPASWKETVGAFATTVGLSLEQVTKALLPFRGEPKDNSAELFSDKDVISDSEIIEALKEFNVPLAVLKAAIKKLRTSVTPVALVETAPSTSSTIQTFSILPSVPDEKSFIEMLKTGGELKVDVTEVLSAVKAGMANSLKLYDLPDIILKKMEAFAEKQEEPCGKPFYEMQKLLTEKKYGDVLAVIGTTGSYVSEARKKAFFIKLNDKLWGALGSFQTALKAWMDSWTGSMNPGMMMMAVATHGSGATLPPGMMAPPDTMPLRSTAEEVINEINRIFAGPGIPIARALAYDSTRIMGILSDPTLPAQIGANTKDQMIKELGITVGADIVRTEQSLTRYTLAIMSLSKVAADAELGYIAAMYQLGQTIQWDKISGGRIGINSQL